jgi:hypothetical protein
MRNCDEQRMQQTSARNFNEIVCETATVLYNLPHAFDGERTLKLWTEFNSREIFCGIEFSFWGK